MNAPIHSRASPKGDLARSKIVKEATALFATKGFEGASLRQIAIACDIPLSSLAHHFPQKQQLQEAAILHSVETLADLITRSIETVANPEAQLAIYIRNLVRVLMSDIPEMRLLDREIYSIAESGLLHMGIAALRTNATNAHVSAVFARSGSDLLDRMSAKRMGDIAFAAIFGVTKFRALHGYDGDPAETTEDALVRDLTTLVMRFLGLEASD